MGSRSLAGTTDYSINSGTTKAGFANPIKARLKKKYGEVCWVCSASPTTFAHVISKSSEYFPLLQEFGIIDFIGLGDESNAILLCPTCHNNFDCGAPNLIIVPSDLEYFIQWEIKDRERRITEFNTTKIMPKRISPTAKDYTAHCVKTHGSDAVPMYTQYIRKDYFPVFMGRQPFPRGVLGRKHWEGSPTAMIQKALESTAIPLWLPKELIVALDRLKMLWFIDDPMVEIGDNNKDEKESKYLQRMNLDNDSNHGTVHTPKNDLSPDNQGSRGSRAVRAAGTAATSTPEYLLSVAPQQVPPPPPENETNIGPSGVPRWETSATSRSSQISDEYSSNNQSQLPGNPKGWRWGPSCSAQSAIDYYSYQYGWSLEHV